MDINVNGKHSNVLDFAPSKSLSSIYSAYIKLCDEKILPEVDNVHVKKLFLLLSRLSHSSECFYFHLMDTFSVIVIACGGRRNEIRVNRA
jgi:hypothetical protein